MHDMEVINKEFDQFKRQYEDIWFFIKDQTGSGKITLCVYDQPILQFQEYNRNLKEKVKSEIKFNLDFLSTGREKNKYLKGILNDLKRIENEIFWDYDENLVFKHYTSEISLGKDISEENVDNEFIEQIAATIYDLKYFFRELITFVKDKIKEEKIDEPKQTKHQNLSNESQEQIIENKQPINGEIKLLSEKEAAKIMGITPRTLQNYRKKEIIEFLRLGRNVRYTKEAIKKFLEDRKIKPISEFI
jgi:excisionase family DNA binding protein